MKIENVLDALIHLIESDDYFSSVNILKAYPCSPAPSRLAGETVALGLEKIKMSSSSVDENNRTGEISVFADIFIPVKKSNDRAFDILSRLCGCFCIYNVLSVSAQRIAVDVNTASYVLKTVFTFNDEIEVN